MAKQSVSVRVDEAIAERLAEEARWEDRTISSLVGSLIEEGLKLRRSPGIAFVSGPAGRRAVLAGTGLDVWEIARDFLALGEDERALESQYHWLSKVQLKDALGYFALHRDEIMARIEREQHLDEEALATRFSHLVPR